MITCNSCPVFVFGSNLAGRHGKGGALYAKEHHGAIYGQGVGRQGQSFAIPTKDEHLNVLPLEVIKNFVDDFLDYADKNRSTMFMVTRIGCGLAGYTDEEIGPMFANAKWNCVLPKEWEQYRADVPLPV